MGLILFLVIVMGLTPAFLVVGRRGSRNAKQ